MQLFKRNLMTKKACFVVQPYGLIQSVVYRGKTLYFYKQRKNIDISFWHRLEYKPDIDLWYSVENKFKINSFLNDKDVLQLTLTRHNKV